MKIIISVFLSLMTNTLIACENHDITDCVYEKHDVRFFYGDQWHIEEESGWFSNPYVFLETEDSGLIMVLIMPNTGDKTLHQFATEYSKSANSQMIMGSFNSKGFTDITSKTDHNGIQEQLTLNVFDLETPMTRQYFSFNSVEKIVYIILQIDDEELDNITGLEKVLSTFEFMEKPIK